MMRRPRRATPEGGSFHPGFTRGMSQSWIVASMTRQRDWFAFSHLAPLAFPRVTVRDEKRPSGRVTGVAGGAQGPSTGWVGTAPGGWGQRRVDGDSAGWMG